MSITVSPNNGKIELLPQGKFVNCFNRYVQYVTIHGDARNEESNQKVLNFFQTRCTKKMKGISFKECGLDEWDTERIAEHLQYIERLSFTGGISATNTYDNIIKHSKRLKSLSISDWEIKDEHFPRNSYPKLEHFECYLNNHPKAALFGDFLQKNPNIKSIICYFMGWSKIGNLQSIFQKAPNVEKAFIDFGEVSGDFVPFVDSLLDERVKLKELQMKLTPELRGLESLKALSSLPFLTGLHIFGKYINTIDVLSNIKFANLKVLQMSTVWCTENAVYDLIQNFENLEEMILVHLRIQSGTSYDRSIGLFASNLKKLSKIVVYGNALFERDLDIAIKLNQQRSALEGACPLVINIKKRQRNRGFVLPKHGGDLVKINYFNEAPSTENPLIKL